MAALRDILLLRCPVCRKGAVFRGPYAMNQNCPSCGIRFEREQGYFLGAMIIAYVLGAFSMIPTIVILVRVYEAELLSLILLPSLQILLLHPVLFAYSRVAWMHLDRNVNPKNWE
jgi:uncharacterized protein (DUF983 family)